jgi:CSLREA domain-containing protein
VFRPVLFSTITIPCLTIARRIFASIIASRRPLCLLASASLLGLMLIPGQAIARVARPATVTHAPSTGAKPEILPSVLASAVRHHSLIQQGPKLTPSGETGAGQFGTSVAISADGNTVLVGAPDDNQKASEPGAAWVFTRSGAKWTQQGPKLTGGVTDDNEGGEFGTSVAISADGNTAIVGDDFVADTATDDGIGGAFVFTRSGGIWQHQGGRITPTVDGTKGAGYGAFGAAVGLSADGNTAIVSGYDGADAYGTAWVFTRSGGEWAQAGDNLALSSSSDNISRQNSALAISGDGKTALLGSFHSKNDEHGSVYAFTRSGDSWSQQGPVIQAPGLDSVAFGVTVALDGDGNTGVVGGLVTKTTATAWLLTRSGGTWTVTLPFHPISPKNAIFGATATISANGNAVLMDGEDPKTGTIGAFLFARSGKKWVQQGPLVTGADGTEANDFDDAMAISSNGSTAVIGGDQTNSNAGAAWVFAKGSITVNQTSDEPDPASSLKDKICDVDPKTEGNQCTLRAAIQLANASPELSQEIDFDLPGSGSSIPVISVNSALPALTAPITIDGSSQPGSKSGLPAVGLEGSKAGADTNGLEIDGAGSTVKALFIGNFHGDGILVKGDGSQVANCAFYRNATGLEVASSGDTIGGEATDVNIFFDNGDYEAMAKFEASLEGRKVTPAELEDNLIHFGAGILVRKAGVSDLTISHNLLGIHGSVLASKLPSDDPGSALSSPFGVLMLPTQGAVSGVTIDTNSIAGDAVGIFIATAGSGSVANVAINTNRIGQSPAGKAYEPFGNLLGILAAGKIAGISLNGDEVEGNIIGAVFAGEDVTAISVQRSVFGDNTNLADLVDPKKETLGLHNVVGLMLIDATGAMIGGADTEAGNVIEGNLIGILMAGKHLANNTVAGNTIGLGKVPKGNIDSLKIGELGSLFGILDVGGTHDTFGLPGSPNTIKGNVLGLSLFGTDRNIMQANAINTNAIGFFGIGSSRNQIGGTAAGAGNAIGNNVVGILMANENLTARQIKDSHLDNASVGQSDREQAFEQKNEQGDLNLINADTSADLNPSSVDALPEVGIANTIQGNTIGGAIGDSADGNDVGLMLLGDLHETVIGGTLPAAANTIAENHQAGVWLLGTTKHYPTASVLGNTIYQNDDFTGPFEAVPGLGIDLVTGTDTSEVDGHGFGPDEQIATSPGAGPDGWQNYPTLTTVTADSKVNTVDVAGTLNSVPSTSFTVQVFADQFCNPYKYGEGQQLLGSIPVKTDASGKASFDQTFPQTLANAPYVSTTATSATTTTSGGTSEFSKCVKATSS